MDQTIVEVVCFLLIRAIQLKPDIVKDVVSISGLGKGYEECDICHVDGLLIRRCLTFKRAEQGITILCC